jgi:hypothetical protein
LVSLASYNDVDSIIAFCHSFGPVPGTEGSFLLGGLVGFEEDCFCAHPERCPKYKASQTMGQQAGHEPDVMPLLQDRTKSRHAG